MYKYFKNNSFAIFLFSQFCIFILLLLSFFIKINSLIFTFYVCIFLLCFVSYYCLYCICKQITFHAKLEAQNILAQHQQEFQEKYFLVSQENMDIITKVRDEIYQKLDTYQDINVRNEDEAREFAKELINEYSFLYQIDYCSNKIIDAILYNKIILAKSYDIETNVQVIVPETINIKPIDIMSVYTNLLDNAIEACLNIEKEKRFIEIDSMVKSNYLIIKITNSKSPDIHVDLKNIQTSKADKKHHGLGTQIILKTCRENNGTFKINDNGDSLESYVTLQIPESKNSSQ